MQYLVVLFFLTMLTACQTVVNVIPVSTLNKDYHLVNSYDNDITKCKRHLEMVQTLENESCYSLWNNRIKLYNAVKYIEKDERSATFLSDDDQVLYTNGKQLSRDLRDIVDLAQNVHSGPDDFGDDVDYLPIDY